MNDEAQWTIDELGAQVSLALSVDYSGQPNGQVSEIPNPRTIRYYQTLGLVDRPGRMRGRTALYGQRHLLQVVAIKRLQALGLSLAEVQTRLAGISEKRLAEVAQVSPALLAGATRGDRPEAPRDRSEVGGSADGAADEPADRHANPTPSGRAARAEGFWGAEPAPVGPARGRLLAAEPAAVSPPVMDRSVIRGTAPDNAIAPAGEALLQGVPLTDGVTLLFAPGRRLDATDIDALRAAAGPLLKLLRYRFSTR